MTTIETNSGRFIDLYSPDPSDIWISDIAHHLAAVCRFGGACDPWYSVAEHSCLVARLMLARGLHWRIQLAGLLHDAHEAYIGDLQSPLKAMFSTGEYSDIAYRFDLVIAAKFDLALTELWSPQVKEFDNFAGSIEAHWLMPSQGRTEHWIRPNKIEPDDPVLFRYRPIGHTPREAKSNFFATFNKIIAQGRTAPGFDGAASYAL